MTEQWTEHPYDSRYQVSSFGRLTRTKQGISRFGQFSTGYNHKGYRKFRGRKVHRLVLEAFVGPCPDGMEVNHKDGDKSNNHLDNLEYVTHTENMRHAEANGLRKPWTGTRWKTNIFSQEDCLKIREILNDGMSQHNLAKMLGVGQMTISKASRIAIQ
jgi:hypothetical protein